jgi:hypothetical protein
MSLRRRIEEALLAQFVDNERLLSAARAGERDPALLEKYEAARSFLKPIVTEIVVERDSSGRE